jgi:hypothetical protein
MGRMLGFSFIRIISMAEPLPLNSTCGVFHLQVQDTACGGGGGGGGGGFAEISKVSYHSIFL